ncbi:MAG: hypothetical protein HRT45_14705 [Bdellovibrionales bacterium]|nr:hypothetical protein [Bdellovibrionales bacterium]
MRNVCNLLIVVLALVAFTNSPDSLAVEFPFTTIHFGSTFHHPRYSNCSQQMTRNYPLELDQTVAIQQLDEAPNFTGHKQTAKALKPQREDLLVMTKKHFIMFEPTDDEIVFINRRTGLHDKKIKIEFDYARSDKLDYDNMTISPDGRHLILGGISRGIAVIDTETEQILGTYKLPFVGKHPTSNHVVSQMRYRNENTVVALASDGALYSFDPLNFDLSLRVYGLVEHSMPTDNFVFGPSNDTALVQGPAGHLIEWDLNEDKQVARRNRIGVIEVHDTMEEFPGAVFLVNIYKSGFNSLGTWIMHGRDNLEQHVLMRVATSGQLERVMTLNPAGDDDLRFEFVDDVEFQGDTLIIQTERVIRPAPPIEGAGQPRQREVREPNTRIIDISDW